MKSLLCVTGALFAAGLCLHYAASEPSFPARLPSTSAAGIIASSHVRTAVDEPIEVTSTASAIKLAPVPSVKLPVRSHHAVPIAAPAVRTNCYTYDMYGDAGHGGVRICD